jgi:hypothetical protein
MAGLEAAQVVATGDFSTQNTTASSYSTRLAALLFFVLNSVFHAKQETGSTLRTGLEGISS